jgi:hypothetical protein
MAKCDNTIAFTGTAADLVAKANAAMTDAGGSFTGDTSAGSFSVPTPLGSVAGTYTISGQSFRVLVTQKPFLVTCAMIVDKLNTFVPHAESLSLT